MGFEPYDTNVTSLPSPHNHKKHLFYLKKHDKTKKKNNHKQLKNNYLRTNKTVLKMEGKTEQNKLTFLQEWCKVIHKKEQWKKINELTKTSYITANPKTKKALAFFIRQEKIDINQLADMNTFSKYSKIPLNRGDWKKINSQIPSACRLYTQIELNKNDIHCQLNMQAYYMINGMEKYAENKKNDNEKAIIDSPAKDNYYGYYLTRLKEMELWNTKAKDARQKILELDDWENAIEFLYHENKLRVLISRLNRTSFQKSDAISAIQHDWVGNIPKRIKNIPQVKYHAMIYDIFANECDTTFDELWQMLKSEDFDSKLDMDEYTYKLCLYLRAYCIHRTSKGHYSFHKRYVDIIHFLKEKGKLLEMGVLPATKLKNIIKSILESKKSSKEARQFLDEYRNYIPNTKNSMILEYCDALILFYEGKYAQVKQKLSPIAIIKTKKGSEDLVKDDLIKINIRYLYIITLIGLNDFNEMETLPKNLQEMFYMKSKHIAEKHMKPYKRGLYFINKIINTPPYGREEHILSILEDEPYFRGKKWIRAVLTHRKKGSNILLPPQ